MMTRILSLALGASLALTGVMATPAHAFAGDDQDQARKEMKAGNILRSREIEARVLPKMRGHEYLGFAYDSTAMAYRLKFIRDGRVTFVDVDARTGRIIGQSR